VSDHDDFAFEPIPGLPEHLPEEESILWQGKPDWMGIANHVLHAKPLALYCAIVIGWVVISGASNGLSALSVLQSLAIPLVLVGALFAILLGLAYGLARSTIYTITNRRVVMRFGMAIPITINLPFSKIETAALKKHGDGSGDIPLALKGNDKLAWLHLWPHTRPWRLTKPEPMLRSLPNVDRVAALLANAMAEAVPEGRTVLPQQPVPKKRVSADPARARKLATA
jgi:hypothetical protein